MVESVNNIQTQSIQKKDNAGRNATVAGAIGLVSGGTAGYMTKQIFKDDKFTDEFIKETKKQALHSIVDDKNEKKALNTLLNIEDNPTIDTAKKFFKNNKKYIETIIGNGTIDDSLKGSDEDILDTFKGVKQNFDENIKTTLDDIPNEISEWFDKNKKKFISSDKLKNNKLYQGVLKAQQKIKGKAGLIWGAATGAVLSIGTFIASKVGGNKQV